jgi:hypothetical protein
MNPVTTLLLTIVDALRDGQLTPDEVADIIEDGLDVLRDDGTGDLLDRLGDTITDALWRDADELHAAADRAEASGHERRAARLRRRAERRQ